ncbi:unnamed protein product [Allacma fusca]|uniref:tRNA:m(4)X modification enzyme TRM13 n=1 Tax=Allacma fusca TaxID=39272 RepID=A0A8J2P0H0_9HEXA|nr:unnamed protein product [Allacma fusca]
MEPDNNTAKANQTASPNENIDSKEIKEPARRPCKFYVARKKRYCRVGVLRNNDDYCAEHSINQGEENEDNKRIPCPFDPAHTCYEKLLSMHLKKCNMRPKEPKEYFSQGINSDDICDTTNGDGPITLAEMSVEELRTLISLVRSVHKEYVPQIPQKFGFHPDLGSEMLRTDVGESLMKHLVQNSSLLSILDESKLLKDSTCFIEFGSGKGALTFWVASTCKSENCHFILLDRQSHRHKKDNKLKDAGLNVERIRIDIEHLKLDKLPAVVDSKHLVGITKHLCGAATDMALKCLLETNDEVSKVSGLALATCCHHRCTWAGYVAKKYLEEWGLSEKYFKCLTGMAGWAVCGTGRAKFEDGPTEGSEVINNPRYAALNLSIEERRKLGLQVKEILDHGRSLYAKSFGLTSAMYHYVDTSTTLENVAIVASR